MNKIAEEVPNLNMLMFINEAAKDEGMVMRRFRHTGRGNCCVIQQWFIQETCYSIIPAIMLDGIIPYDIVEGPVDMEQFLKFLRE
ncbi:hypothetical protein V8B97DRAFT_1876339 [Scleroderma yunnanense]